MDDAKKTESKRLARGFQHLEMLFSLQLIFFMYCAIQYITLHISSVRKPMKETEEGPKLQQLPHPRYTDPLALLRRLKSINKKWRLKSPPFPSAEIRVWLLELLDVSANLWSVAQPHHKQRLGLYPQFGTAGVTCEIGPATSRHLTPSMINSCFHFFITQPEHNTFLDYEHRMGSQVQTWFLHFKNNGLQVERKQGRDTSGNRWSRLAVF